MFSSSSAIFVFKSTVLFMLLLASAYAKQLVFDYDAQNGLETFSYQWQENNEVLNLSFSIDSERFKSMPQTKAAFSNDRMQREIQVALLKHAQQVNPRLARVEVKRQGQRVQFGVSSRTPEHGEKIMAELKETSKLARQTFLDEHFFTDYRAKTGAMAIKQDHARYAKQSAEALEPIVDAIKRNLDNPDDPRAFISLALSWLQSIPYNTMESRLSSNGAGFVSPKDLLLQNQGDCDSKATFLAALLRAYSAGAKMQLVLLPEHALLAVALPKKPDEKIVKHEGINYILLEATGPAYFDIGEVDEDTWRAIKNRQYSLEAM
ncbi:hypothetical protein PN836_009320 [Ningiella sp. W23]|uniref:hypothetical protein n=1 Tax=Ningiella sp. W23 TaxID=3023715 RepID=UPI003756B79B